MTSLAFKEAIIVRTKTVRESLGMTQAALAALLEIPQDKYKQYETRTPLPHKLIPKFCAIGQVTVSWLLTGTERNLDERHRIGPRKPVHLFLKLHRKHKGLTQQQVADRFETRDGEPVSKGTISRWENNERIIGTDELAAYAEAIGVPATALYRPPSDHPSFDEIAAKLPRELRQKAFEIITWFAS